MKLEYEQPTVEFVDLHTEDTMSVTPGGGISGGGDTPDGWE